MKVILVNPGRNVEFATSEPLNLESIGSYLRLGGIEVRIVDELAGQNVRREVLRYKPDVVGITATTPLAPDAYRIGDMCRKMGFRVVMGGVHATLLPEEALQHADVVVKGEGEAALFFIVDNNIDSGIVNGTTLPDLDDVPPFDKSGLEMDFYFRLPETYEPFIPTGTRTATMLTQRGCGYHCIFCHNSWRDVKYRCNSAERVVVEIQSLIKRYGIKAVYFLDDNLFMNRPRLRKICELLLQSGTRIIWVANSRVDNLDLETLKLARQSGCRQVQFGFESGSQRMLDFLNKKTTVQQNAKAIELCHQAGLLAQGTFMIGCPTETIEDVRMTQQFIKENNPDSVGICLCTPFPGTGIWDWCKAHGLLPDRIDWSTFAVTKFRNAIYACDTISPADLEKLFCETDALIASKKQRVPRRWFLSMALHHPIKTLVMARRSRRDWGKYFRRIGRGA